MSKVAIIGFGYVGKAMYQFFKNHNEMTIYDPHAKAYGEDIKSTEVELNGVNIDISKVNLLVPCYLKNTITAMNYLDKEIDQVNQCDVAVICVPTPRGEDGSCDTSIVEDVLSKLKNDLIILKSTVEVGTTEKLVDKYKKNIIFCPEFAGESTYWSPYKFHTEVVETPHFIFGGDKKLTTKAVDIYTKIGGPTKKYMQTDSRTAEMVKYIENCFYATKVTFCYEVANICNEMGIDYNEARELWLLDPRINPMHTSVFKDNEKPFGGKCFPKDLSALVSLSDKIGYDASLLREVLNSNDRIAEYRKKNNEGNRTNN